MTRSLKLLLSTTVVAVVLSGTANADGNAESEGPGLGKLMWAALECGAYAEMSGSKEVARRLYELGIATGRRLINEWDDLPDWQRKDTPIGITMLFGGPSADFMIGRIYESIISDTFDKLVKHDDDGRRLSDPSEWANDEMRKARAESRYRGANCSLVGR